jgi:hypothetical protein
MTDPTNISCRFLSERREWQQCGWWQHMIRTGELILFENDAVVLPDVKGTTDWWMLNGYHAHVEPPPQPRRQPQGKVPLTKNIVVNGAKVSPDWTYRDATAENTAMVARLLGPGGMYCIH